MFGARKKSDKPKPTAKQRIKSAAKFGAWTAATVGAAAIYNHIDAGIIAAEADQSATVSSQSGKVELSYQHIPGELTEILAALPDRIESDLRALPIAKNETKLLLQSKIKIRVLANTDWDGAPEEFFQVDASGTIQLNAERIKLARDPDLLRQGLREEYVNSASKIVAHLVTSNLVEWTSWNETAKELHAAALPIKFLASSDLQSAFVLTNQNAAALLQRDQTERENQKTNLLNYRSGVVSDLSLPQHSVSYFNLKQHLESTYSLAPAAEMIYSRNIQPSYAQLQALAKYTEVAPGHKDSTLPAGAYLSLSEIVAKRRNRSIHEADLAARSLTKERIESLENGLFAKAIQQGVLKHDRIQLGNVEMIRATASEIERLYAPYKEANDEIGDETLQNLGTDLIKSLHQYFLKKGEYPPQSWEVRDALATVLTFKNLFEQNYKTDDLNASLKELEQISSLAIQVTLQQYLSDREYVDVNLHELIDVFNYAQEVASKIESPSLSKQVEEFSAVLKDNPQFLQASKQTLIFNRPTLDLLEQSLNPQELRILNYVCTNRIYVQREDLEARGYSPPGPDELAQLLSSEWFSSISPQSRTTLLKELVSFNSSSDFDASFYMRRASRINFNPSDRIQDLFNLQLVCQVLPESQRRIAIEALISLPPLLRTSVLLRIADVQREQRAKDDYSVDSNNQNFGYFSRVGVLSNALEVLINNDPAYQGINAFDIVDRLTLGAAKRTSWASNVDVYASSSAKQLSWGSIIADGEYGSSFRGEIEKKVSLRKAFPLVQQHMQDFELRVSRGIGWITNKVESIFDHDQVRPTTTGIFHQNPRSGVGEIEQDTLPQAGVVLVGKQYASDFNSFFRAAARWQDSLQQAYGADIEVHGINSPKQVENILKERVAAAISQGKTEEFVLVINAHGSSRFVSVEGATMRGEGSQYASRCWLDKQDLEESGLKAIVNQFVAPYFKRVSVIFDSCHSGGWTE